MEILAEILPIAINILLIVLLTVGIILLIKCIYIIDKAKAILQNVEDKVNSLNSIFKLIDLVNDQIAAATDRIVSFFENILMKIFKKEEKAQEEVRIVKKERKWGKWVKKDLES